MSQPYLSLVLACYNEEQVLERSFAEVLEVLEGLGRPFEVLCIDDCSRDGTRAILSDLQRRHAGLDLHVRLHETNQGRGATVSEGFRLARGRFTGFLDIDLEVHARYIPSLLRALEQGADVASVRRIYAFQLRAVDRYVMSRAYSALVRRALGTRLHDTETGYKFFRREPLLALLDEVRDSGWFWDTEIMVRAERRGLRLTEVPGAYIRRYDKTSTVHGLRDSWDYFWRLLAFRRELRAGRRA